jgi:hypothetical protein
MRLAVSGVPERKLQKLERRALQKLRGYDHGRVSLETALKAVMEYDQPLARAELLDDKLLSGYRKTLQAHFLYSPTSGPSWLN